MSNRPDITIPRPHVPYGPHGVPEDEADANYLRDAARKLEEFYRPFGSNLRATVVLLIRDAAAAIEAPPRAPMRTRERAAQLAAVLALHRKMPLWGHEDRCTNATDDHREERHELIDGEFWCRDIADDWTCAECAELMDGGLGEHPAWPCATVRAIEEATG